MKVRSFLTFHVCGIACIALSFTGCTLGGFIVGSVIDGSTCDKDTLKAAQFHALKPGDELTVTCLDSLVVRGDFVGLDSLRRFMDGERSPCMTAICIKTNGVHEWVPMERVQQVERTHSNNAWLMFMGIGFAADILIVNAISREPDFLFLHVYKSR